MLVIPALARRLYMCRVTHSPTYSIPGFALAYAYNIASAYCPRFGCVYFVTHDPLVLICTCTRTCCKSSATRAVCPRRASLLAGHYAPLARLCMLVEPRMHIACMEQGDQREATRDQRRTACSCRRPRTRLCAHHRPRKLRRSCHRCRTCKQRNSGQLDKLCCSARAET